MKLRTVVVDDEPLARKTLELLLAEREDVVLTANFGKPREALLYLLEQPPELLFLDIKMPGLSGLELLGQLADQLGETQLPRVIMVTAYDRYALAAFERHALDYLLKPVEDARFHQAVDRAVRQRTTDRQAAAWREMLRTQTPTPTRLSLEENGRVILLDRAELIRVEAADHYLIFHTAADRHVIRASLRDWIPRLDGFVQISRAMLVNPQRVRRLEGNVVGGTVLITDDGLRLEVSRRRAAEVRRLLAGS